MYYTDYHSHSILSPDGHVPLADMADAAVRAGLAELCLTDHYDLQGEHGGRSAPFDWSPALRQFHETAPRYAGRLKLRLGLELGGIPVDPACCRTLLAQPELDFVIGSLHNMSPAAGGTDFYYQDYSSEDTCYTALDDYFSSMESLAALSGLYDVLGHIIYPLRYMPPTVTLARYRTRLEAILRTAIAVGCGIEVNTYCGRTVEAWRDILALYRSLGGELVTVGADAHTPDNVGKGIPEACALLRETGFRYYTVYEKRRPEQIKL